MFSEFGGRGGKESLHVRTESYLFKVENKNSQLKEDREVVSFSQGF